MKRCRALVMSIALLFLLLLNFSTVHAGEKTVAEGSDTAVGSILDLLKEKKIISNEESSAFIRQMGHRTLAREDLKALVNLLREKGVVTGDEAAGFIQKLARTPLSEEEKAPIAQAPVAQAPVAQPSVAKVQEVDKLILPSGDKEFIRLLRELWIKKGGRAVDFDAQFGDVTDVEEVIGRMRVMGMISPAYATKLDEFYRERFLSGAVTTVLEGKEKDYIDQIRKNTAWEIDEKIQNKLKDEWWQKIRLSGDIRLRYEGDFYDNNNGVFLNPSNPALILNSRTNQALFRLRARLGVDAKVADGVDVGFGLATGTTSNPVSTNVTLGDFFNKQSITIDKGFLKWSPDPVFTAWGGRFPNPWFYTDLVWDRDVNFDGVAFQYKPKLSTSWGVFLNAGAFPLQFVDQHQKWLFGGQLGAQYNRADQFTAKLGVGFYDYENTVGVVNNPAQPGANDWSAPLFQQKGNTLMDIDPSPAIKTAYAAEYRELNVTGSLDLGYWHPLHVVLIGDYVRNLGFNQQQVTARAAPVNGGNVKQEVDGFQLGFTVGHPTVQKFGDWKGLLFYKYLGSDAVIDAFTDSDFHLGGTNAKGWIIGGDFGLTRNVWLSTRWYTANEISGPPLGIDVLHFDLNAKF